MSTPTTLRKLISLLERCENQKAIVQFDFCDFRPSGSFYCYRGYYDHVAIGFNGPREGTEWTVSGFIDFLKSIEGAEREGYKGGDFIFDGNTPVWVADGNGHCSQNGVCGVIDGGYIAVLETAYYDF